MLKKILFIIFFIFVFVQTAFSKELFRVTSVNLDTSNQMLFLTSPDNTSEPILNKIKLVKLTKPQRAYFDIDSAMLTAPAQNWYINSGGLTQVKIGQFSSNPNKIRVVMYFTDDFNPQKISFLKLNNNIIIKFKDGMCRSNFYQPVYRDENSAGYDINENVTISDAPLDSKLILSQKSDEIMNQIQYAFNPKTTTSTPAPIAQKTHDVVKKDLKLASRYYINEFSLKLSGVIVSGSGNAAVEKPIILENPSRVAFDIPNAFLAPALKNKELKINPQESVKIAQYGLNKVRVVINTPDVQKYLPVFAADDQSILIANPEVTDIQKIFTKTTDVVSYSYKSIDKKNDEYKMFFNAPLVMGVKRDTAKLTLFLYNAYRYNDTEFKNSIKASSLCDMKIDLMPTVGLKLSMPLNKDSIVTTSLGADGKSFRLLICGTKIRSNIISKTTTPVKKIYLSAVPIKPVIYHAGSKKVVLDPGHGGSDYGAIRAGINEKDITLDVSKRVEAILHAKGINVYMTRDIDKSISLQDRTVFSASKSPDIFVSIHVNSCVGPDATGLETHYYHPESFELAKTVHSSLISYIKSPDRGLIKSRFYVINHTSVPSILVEIGFLSNDRERAELVSEQRKQQTAKSIAEGIMRYLNEHK